MPFGAEVLPERGVEFRLWAPRAGRVELCLETHDGRSLLPMDAAGEGWFKAVAALAADGALYRFRIDEAECVPDPASRFQPNDVHGRSCVVDPSRFVWHDAEWSGRPWEEAVVYELHVGTFTAAGDYAGAAERLAHLANLGITAVELMPAGEFPGRRNWGYDSVYPFAPESSYGGPNDLKAFIETAHRAGIMVIMDVVYNHFGPEGNYLHLYARDFFTDRHRTPWGPAINYDGARNVTVRRFFIDNALYWLEEFNVDGLRLDAVHAIVDESEPDILVELAQAVRSRVPPHRHVHLLLENDNNASRYLRRDAGGNPSCYTAQWNEDWHHVWHVLLSGETHGYYHDFADDPRAHLLRCLIEGFAYQGERSVFRGMKPRGEPSADLPSAAFIAFLQNHDQVGNRPFGERLTVLTGPERLRAAVAVQLLAPSIPALFMGEELGCRRPFLFFTDFAPELRASVREGRRQELERSGALSAGTAARPPPDPGDAATFERSVLDWNGVEDASEGSWLGYYRALLELRRRMIVPRLRGARGDAPGSRLLGRQGLVACWRMGDGSRLRLVANLSDTPLALDRDTTPAIFRQPDRDPGRADSVLPPWFVGWFLDGVDEH
jgi:malto-oligosyltrehalose trehalohydrolase